MEIAAVSPSGETVPVDLQLSDSEPDTYVISYTPMEIGDHMIYVKFAGINVRGSPFIVKVADPSKVLVQMSSLTEAQDAMVVDREVVIPLEILPGAGEGELEAEIAGPGDVAVESSFTRQSDTLYHFRFIPPVSGEYIVKVLYGGGLVGGHALNAYVREALVRADASKCVVYGEGIKECKHCLGIGISIDILFFISQCFSKCFIAFPLLEALLRKQSCCSLISETTLVSQEYFLLRKYCLLAFPIQ